MCENDFKYDMLTEMFNIGVGKAAGLLSEIIDRTILLNIPKIKISNQKEQELKSVDYLPKVLDGTLMVSSISFKEQLTGKANLIFPAKEMRTFINLCLNQADDTVSNDMNFTDVDFDVIKEIGNIILNCIIGEIGNHLDMQLDYTLPEVQVFDRIDFDKDVKSDEYKSVIILYITFVIDGTEIGGAVLVDLTLNSLNELMKNLDLIEDEFNG